MTTPSSPVRVGQTVEVATRRADVPPRTGAVTAVQDDMVYVTNVDTADGVEERIFGQWVDLGAFEGRDPESAFVGQVVS
ncbi:hypothetical protein [Nocardioides pakistanensis]